MVIIGHEIDYCDVTHVLQWAQTEPVNPHPKVTT